MPHLPSFSLYLSSSPPVNFNDIFITLDKKVIKASLCDRGSKKKDIQVKKEAPSAHGGGGKRLRTGPVNSAKTMEQNER